MSATAIKNEITLKGSAAIISEYLKYAINSILFQRGLFPEESFTREQKYGITMATNSNVMDFLNNSFEELGEWFTKDKVNKVSMIIVNVETNETIECWDFTVTPDPILEGFENLIKIRAEIRDFMRQIAATVSCLPHLECACGFSVVVSLSVALPYNLARNVRNFRVHFPSSIDIIFKYN